MKILRLNMQFTFLVLLCFFLNQNLIAQDYRVEVTTIINKMDSILVMDSLENRGYWLESRSIGEANTRSKIYPLYKDLLETAITDELLDLIADSTLKPPIRGYSYMAYAYHVDSLGISEVPTDYYFNINVLIGCIGTKQTFKDFKTKARVRGLNNPYPKNIFISQEEKDVIEQENKIRQEQGLPLRK